MIKSKKLKNDYFEFFSITLTRIEGRSYEFSVNISNLNIFSKEANLIVNNFLFLKLIASYLVQEIRKLVTNKVTKKYPYFS